MMITRYNSMAYFPNTPAIVAITIATRNIGRGSGSGPSNDSDGNLFPWPVLVILGIPFILLFFIGFWIVFCEVYGKPVHTQTTVGVITSIESRPYKNTTYYTVSTSQGYRLTIYRDEPIVGETVFKTIDSRPFSRLVMYYINSGGQTGYCQIWPFIDDQEK